MQLRGYPALRYGVSGPVAAPLGDIVILPGYGESAEWWFETVRDLNDAGYTAWVLDGAGQGGSGRFDAVRDLGHAPDFEADVRGLTALIGGMVRPTAPVTVIASGAAALPALAAVERGAPIEGLVLSAPSAPPFSPKGAPYIAARLGLTTVRAKGAEPWRRPTSFETARQKNALGWAIANPDLRMGGPSAGWLLARQKLAKSATAPEALARVRASIVIIAPSEADDIPCERLLHCKRLTLPATLPYQVETDAHRGPWLAAIVHFLGTDHAS